MLSSISNSETSTRPFLRATWAFVALAVTLYGAAELLAMIGMEHISKLHKRIMTDARQAQALRPASPGEPPVVLFVGNSLLLKGIDLSQLAAGVKDRYAVRRYVIEATSYTDWFYGLKRLFRDGMRVNSVVLSLNSLDFTSPAFRGDFTSHVLFDAEDIWPISQETNASLTATAGFYFAHYSAFYAYRNELRSVLLGKISPDAVRTMQSFQWGKAVIPPDTAVIPIMKERLLALQKLCATYEASFTYLVPPTPLAGDTALVEAGQQTGIPVLHPIADADLGLEFYEEDQFHLNTKGAERFTKAVIETLEAKKL